MLELAACQSAQVRRHRHAVECRLRHRPMLLPWPTPANPPQPALVARHAWRRVHRRSGCASDANQSSTPGFCRRGPWLHEPPIRPKTGAAMPCSWRRRRTSRRGRSGQEWRSRLLKLRKTARSQGCKWDVLCGGMKHSTTCGNFAFMAIRVPSLAWAP